MKECSTCLQFFKRCSLRSTRLFIHMNISEQWEVKCTSAVNVEGRALLILIFFLSAPGWPLGDIPLHVICVLLKVSSCFLCCCCLSALLTLECSKTSNLLGSHLMHVSLKPHGMSVIRRRQQNCYLDMGCGFPDSTPTQNNPRVIRRLLQLLLPRLHEIRTR